MAFCRVRVFFGLQGDRSRASCLKNKPPHCQRPQCVSRRLGTPSRLAVANTRIATATVEVWSWGGGFDPTSVAD